MVSLLQIPDKLLAVISLCRFHLSSQLTIQLALMGLAEFVFHLTRMNPDQMYLHQDCGYLSISFFKFDVDDQSGESPFTGLNGYV